MSAVAAILVGLALWSWPSARWKLFRVVPMPERVSGQARWLGVRTDDDPFALAAALELLSVCLCAGLPVASAVRVAARSAPESLGHRLRSAAELLEFGSDPEIAWAAVDLPVGKSKAARSAARVAGYFNDLAALARRSSRAGSALAQGVSEMATSIRREAQDSALARAERAGVMISGPLGCCFLPAFICLGIVPVVIGLATQTLGGI